MTVIWTVYAVLASTALAWGGTGILGVNSAAGFQSEPQDDSQPDRRQSEDDDDDDDDRDPPELDVTPPPPTESILDELDEGVAGDMIYTNFKLDDARAEFARRAKECDLEAYLAAWQRYLAELDAILARTNLEPSVRQQLTRERDALAAQRPLLRIPLGCPGLGSPIR